MGYDDHQDDKRIDGEWGETQEKHDRRNRDKHVESSGSPPPKGVGHRLQEHRKGKCGGENGEKIPWTSMPSAQPSGKMHPAIETLIASSTTEEIEK